MERKGKKAIIDGQEVILITCAKGFWASTEAGILKDSKGYRVFTKEEAKKGVKEWEDANRHAVDCGAAPDSEVEALISHWRQLVSNRLYDARLLTKREGEFTGIEKTIAGLMTTGLGRDPISGQPCPPSHRRPTEEEAEAMRAELAAIDERMASNEVASVLNDLGIIKFDGAMLSLKLEGDDFASEEDKRLFMRCMNRKEMDKALNYSKDNTWMYARIAVEKPRKFLSNDI